jgi:hypothetical protein
MARTAETVGEAATMRRAARVARAVVLGRRMGAHMPGRELPPRWRVVAWGRSVLASALVAGLATRTDLDVVQVEAALPAALEELRLRQAHAVLCDLASVPAACVLTLLAAHPHLVVVIIDTDADYSLALTCRQPRTRTVDDLVTALIDGAGNSNGEPPRPPPAM